MFKVLATMLPIEISRSQKGNKFELRVKELVKVLQKRKYILRKGKSMYKSTVMQESGISQEFRIPETTV